jgi:hypothetical protein
MAPPIEVEGTLMVYKQTGTEQSRSGDVANIAAPATASATDVANKINELLDALRAANIIG